MLWRALAGPERTLGVVAPAVCLAIAGQRAGADRAGDHTLDAGQRHARVVDDVAGRRAADAAAVAQLAQAVPAPAANAAGGGDHAAVGVAERDLDRVRDALHHDRLQDVEWGVDRHARLALVVET